MARSFTVTVSSRAGVEQIHAALGDENYWLTRLSEFGGGSTLDSLSVDNLRTVRVAISQNLRQELLPAMLSSLYRRDLKITHTETWQSDVDGGLHGEIDVAVHGAPGSGSGAALVAPASTGSQMTFTATVHFKVPVLGSRIESYLAREFARGIPELQRFTTEWISDHG